MSAAPLARRVLLLLGALLVAGAVLLGSPLPGPSASTAPGLGPSPAAAAAPAAPSPSPTPAVTPSSPPGEMVVRDETGTGLVLPILLGTVVVILGGAALFASAVTRRRSEERRL